MPILNIKQSLNGHLLSHLLFKRSWCRSPDQWTKEEKQYGGT